MLSRVNRLRENVDVLMNQDPAPSELHQRLHRDVIQPAMCRRSILHTLTWVIGWEASHNTSIGQACRIPSEARGCHGAAVRQAFHAQGNCEHQDYIQVPGHACIYLTLIVFLAYHCPGYLAVW